MIPYQLRADEAWVDLSTILVIHPLRILYDGRSDWLIRIEWQHMFAQTSFKFDIPISRGLLPHRHVDNPLSNDEVCDEHRIALGEVYLPFVEAWKAQDPAAGKAA